MKKSTVLAISKLKFALSVNLMIVFVLLHNIIEGFFGIKERLFFTLFVLTFAYFMASAVYSLYVDVIEK